MKKYPIFYQDKEYEVRWYNGSILDTISVYEVRPQKFFKYKELDTFYTHAIDDLYDLSSDDEDLYSKQAMYAVKLALDEIEATNRFKTIKETQKQKLQEWNGVIE